MIELSYDEVAHATGGTVHPAGDAGHDVGVVDAVATDSRAVPAGRPLFVALRGEEADGHRYVGAAVEGGAVAVLAEHLDAHTSVPTIVVDDTWAALRALGGEVRRRVDPTAVAITGSVGKTTVKDLTAAAVAAGRRTHAARGSFNNELGVPLTLLGLAADTEVLVAEIGARHEGDIAALAPLVAPDVSVVTAVAGVHLEVFGTIEAIARAKSELVTALGDDGTAVLNVADPRVAAMAPLAAASISVAVDDPAADVHARDVRLDRLARPSAIAVTPWGTTELRLPIAGRHHVGNALLALAVAGHLGVDLDAAAEALAAAPMSPWRGEVTDAGGVCVFNDAYNANPTAVAAALDTLVAIERSGTTWAVLGVMAEIGDDADAEHRAVGARVAELGIEHLVVVGEAAAAIAVGAREAGYAGHLVEVEHAAAASRLLGEQVVEGDVILVKASRVGGLEAVAHGLIEARARGVMDS